MNTEPFDELASYIKSKIAIREEELEHIRLYSVIKKLKKKQFLLQQGDVWQLNVFVASGCLRIYSVDDKGTEHILNFAVENGWTGDRASLLSGKPSTFNIDAVEDSVLVIIKEEHFERLRREIPLFDQMVNEILHRGFIAAQQRIHAAISYSAEEKYLHFLRKYPSLNTRLPQSMIASYLGISAETLSRMRNKVARKR
ncbi:Crp/Fnr family transcriptional regulator [Spirosoma pollinicola]|uniref:Cyclic nucleotide-binding protein n=1 Tax=Spirosoma pollinicola TaxID=2057025 RepID=A0A2K8YTU7_9BACT|nr:Crp/Fnr family transcriptional regulator [Spirosoma pollinicola]AUD01009.1 cyclic nucleotide-binding protein [Spirosoma pollinicola]